MRREAAKTSARSRLQQSRAAANHESLFRSHPEQTQLRASVRVLFRSHPEERSGEERFSIARFSSDESLFAFSSVKFQHGHRSRQCFLGGRGFQP